MTPLFTATPIACSTMLLHMLYQTSTCHSQGIHEATMENKNKPGCVRGTLESHNEHVLGLKTSFSSNTTHQNQSRYGS